jgi:hypothetical protein
MREVARASFFGRFHRDTVESPDDGRRRGRRMGLRLSHSDRGWRIAALGALVGVVLAAPPACAQAQTIMAPENTQQGAPPRNPMCVRLEAQLAAFDRGQGSDRATEIRRTQDAVTRQQAEVDRLSAQARGLNCGGGFFLFGGHPPQCDQLNAQTQRARTALDQMMEHLQRLEGAGNDRQEERQSIVVALAQNNCGPQYRAAAAAQPRSFLGSLFGGPPESVPEPPPAPEAPVDSSTYRTVCVRMCDGSFFPISFATTPAKFAADERACQRVCPATQVALYAYHNAGEDISKAVSISGQPYTALPNAFRFRQSYDPNCTCKRAGESWAAAVKNDDTIERGDIVVTDETAKRMSRPPPKPAAGRSDNTRSNSAHGRARTSRRPSAAAAAPPITPSTSASALPAPSHAARPVGPRFYQVQ